jgi:hypothetical protein
LLTPQYLVFIDETGVSTNMTRLRGRAPEGQRLIGKVPHGHWNITTFNAALRCDRIGELMIAFSEQECRNFLAHQGYAST